MVFVLPATPPALLTGRGSRFYIHSSQLRVGAMVLSLYLVKDAMWRRCKVPWMRLATRRPHSQLLSSSPTAESRSVGDQHMIYVCGAEKQAPPGATVLRVSMRPSAQGALNGFSYKHCRR